MVLVTGLLAFYVAWNLGANDVANSMGTSVGSKAVTLKQALIIAGVLELSGAVLFGRQVSQTLVTEIVNPSLFVQAPQVFLTGMLAVLLASGLWLNLATAWGFPVSSTHAVVGAIAGFGGVTVGIQAVNWRSLGTISLTWVVTPVVSGLITALFYTLIKRWILEQPHPLEQLREWIPWLSTVLFSVFGVLVFPTLTQPVQAMLQNRWGVVLPSYDLPLALGAIAAITLTLISWRQLAKYANQQDNQNGLPIEQQLGRFQVLSACFVAFAHGSNDVGNAVAPLAAIAYIHRTHAVPLNDFQVPFWVLGLGGMGIVTGLAIWGKKVIATIGEGITPLQPSGGFCAELATATTILLASRLGLPASTSHALVGGVVAIGLLQGQHSVRWQIIREIGLVWLITIPSAAGLGAVIFSGLRLFLLG
ncbi:MAG: anion permease [Leptolyngbyaceae bacterium]|nr:anion permease [Leptolyngbyaceae bacterium]